MSEICYSPIHVSPKDYVSPTDFMSVVSITVFMLVPQFSCYSH